MPSFLQLLLILLLVKSSISNKTTDVDTVDFAHETCQLETLSTNEYKVFYSTFTFHNELGVLELLVRFKGIADGHICLSVNASDEEPRYTIGLGTYNNKFSEIRRGKPTKLEFKINTPGILSDHQYRGFLIRYNKNTGALLAFSEGSDIPLVHLVDPQPLEIKYFSFSTWLNRVVLVAFNCQAKDNKSNFVRRSDNMNDSPTTNNDTSKNSLSCLFAQILCSLQAIS